MFRKAIANKLEGEKKEFRFRGHEVRRIEAFSDAVFAFSVTLLIVSLEVPRSFEELMVTMRGFFAFGVTFTLLMSIWYEQNIFFRRYGLDDLKTIVLNCTLIFLVLFYVYPLKFLFTFLFSGVTSGNGSSSIIINAADVQKLMVIYGTGYMSIYFLFSFMYIHALKKAKKLELTKEEIFDTRTKFYKNIILIAIGIFAITISIVLSAEKSGLGGMSYIIIGPALSIFYSYRGNLKRKIFNNNQ